MLRFDAHIRWVDEHGAIDEADNYLRSLGEDQ